MTKTFEPSSPQVPLRFGSQNQRDNWHHGGSDYFGIYSCRFSADGHEVIAGGNGNQGELRGKRFLRLSIITNINRVSLRSAGEP